MQVSSGQVNQIALDNRGRIFTWGGSNHNGSSTGQTPIPIGGEDAFLMNPAINTDLSSSGNSMLYPYQVGTKFDWIKVAASESTYIAIDAAGSLYGWGASAYGITGIEVDTGYYFNGTLDKWERPGNTLIVPTLINSQQWTDFALGWYHILAQKADKSLWIWGTNLSNATYGTLTYADDYLSAVPIQMTWLPASPVKLFDADYSVSVIVTEANQVYIWGDYAWTTIQTPTLFPLTLPEGVTIVKCQCSFTGFGILLSNGEIYCAGKYLAFVATPFVANTLTLVPGGHNFVDFRIFSEGAIARDNLGNLWGWGIGTYVVSQNVGACDLNSFQPGEQPLLTAAAIPGERQWITMDIGGWTHCAINSQGELFTWGLNAYGELGVDLMQSELHHTCPILQVAYPTLDDGVLAYEETANGAYVIRIPIPKQLAAHDPCGHWHKGGGSTSRVDESYAANCWEPTIATDGITVLYAIAGRHRPNELYLLLYNIPSNVWSTLIFRKDVLHSNWDAGVSLAGSVYAYHNYAYDITGEPYNEITSNPRMITHVVGQNLEHDREWPGSTEIHGRNKVAVAADGKVTCIVRTSINWDIHGSTDYGVTYSIIQAFSVSTVTDAAIVISPNDGLVYVAVIQASTNALRVYSGNISGTGWALKSTTTVVDNPNTLRFHVDGSRFFATVGGPSPSTTRFYYSTNNCASFTARDLHEYSIYFAATGKLLYNLADDVDWRTDDYEDTVISWNSVAQSNTLTDRCTLHNAGQIAVFSQAKLRVDGSAGNIVSILLSRSLGERWDEIHTPLNYYETFEETLNLSDNPVWPFVPQYAKF